MSQFYRRTRILMGAPLELTAFGTERCCANAFEAVFQEVDRIERLFTVYRSDSPLAQLNKSYERGQGHRLDREIIKIISCAFDYAKRSDGAFDPTSGPLIDLWGFGASEGNGIPPSEDAILSTRERVGYRNIRVFPKEERVVFLKDGMSLNLGGIVKGYAIDCAVKTLLDHGITRGLVSFGSSLYALGRPPDKAGWRIGIQHPRREGAETVSVLLADQALASSGDYERCFYHEGKRFSHIIDPRTGRPVSGMASVSLIGASAMEVDALSTAAFVLGVDEGKEFLEDLSGVAGLMISERPNGVLNSETTGEWVSFSPDSTIGRRRFLAMLGCAVIGLLLPVGAEGAAIRFATENEALRRMIPDAEVYDTEEISLTKAQHKEAQALIGKGFRKKVYQFWVGRKGGAAIGYAVKLNVIGKKRPITFLIGIDPAGQVKGVEVLVYRESRGSEVRYKRFMGQFMGKKKGDSLRLGQDIRPISGATLSSRSTAYAVKKGLALFEVVYKDHQSK